MFHLHRKRAGNCHVPKPGRRVRERLKIGEIWLPVLVPRDRAARRCPLMAFGTLPNVLTPSTIDIIALGIYTILPPSWEI